MKMDLEEVEVSADQVTTSLHQRLEKVMTTVIGKWTWNYGKSREEFTSLDKKKRGTAFLLELGEGKVKNAIRSLGIAVITAEDGITQIIAHLDQIYEEDTAQVSYRVYSKFEKYVRPESLPLQSYISEFEKMIADLKRQKIDLPDAVLAYRLLNSANLSAEKVDLAMATVKELTYKVKFSQLDQIAQL